MAHLEIHERIALNKAASEDVYMLDLTTATRETSDQAHGYIGSTLRLAQNRFNTYLAMVPHHKQDAALEYISDKADEITLDRFTKARNRTRTYAV